MPKKSKKTKKSDSTPESRAQERMAHATQLLERFRTLMTRANGSITDLERMLADVRGAFEGSRAPASATSKPSAPRRTGTARKTNTTRKPAATRKAAPNTKPATAKPTAARKTTTTRKTTTARRSTTPRRTPSQ